MHSVVLPDVSPKEYCIAQKILRRLQSAIPTQKAYDTNRKQEISDAISTVLVSINEEVIQHSLDREKIIAILFEELEHKIKYFQERIHRKYDYGAFANATVFFMVGLVWGYLTCLLIDKQNKPFDDEFKLKVAQLAKLGIYINEERLGNTHTIILKSITLEGLAVAREFGPELVKIRDRQQLSNNKSFTLNSIATTITSVSSFVSFFTAWEFVKKGFNAKYKEDFADYQELLNLLKLKIQNQNRIAGSNIDNK